jgi:hypothetical protein
MIDNGELIMENGEWVMGLFGGVFFGGFYNGNEQFEEGLDIGTNSFFSCTRYLFSATILTAK